MFEALDLYQGLADPRSGGADSRRCRGRRSEKDPLPPSPHAAARVASRGQVVSEEKAFRVERERGRGMEVVADVVRGQDGRAGDEPDATASEHRRTRTRRGRWPRARGWASAPKTPEATRAGEAQRRGPRSSAGATRRRRSVDPDASRGDVDARGSGAVGRHDRPRLRGSADAVARRPAPVAFGVRERTPLSRFHGVGRANRTPRAARRGGRPRTPGGAPSPRFACPQVGTASLDP